MQRRGSRSCKVIGLTVHKKLYKKQLEAYITASVAINENADNIANGLIPQLEAEIKTREELLPFLKDQTAIRSLNSEIELLKKSLTSCV